MLLDLDQPFETPVTKLLVPDISQCRLKGRHEGESPQHQKDDENHNDDDHSINEAEELPGERGTDDWRDDEEDTSSH